MEDTPLLSLGQFVAESAFGRWSSCDGIQFHFEIAFGPIVMGRI